MLGPSISYWSVYFLIFSLFSSFFPSSNTFLLAHPQLDIIRIGSLNFTLKAFKQYPVKQKQARLPVDVNFFFCSSPLPSIQRLMLPISCYCLLPSLSLIAEIKTSSELSLSLLFFCRCTLVTGISTPNDSSCNAEMRHISTQTLESLLSFRLCLFFPSREDLCIQCSDVFDLICLAVFDYQSAKRK